MWVSTRLAAEVWVAALSTHVAWMTHWGSGSSDPGRPDNTAVKGCCATCGRNASRCGRRRSAGPSLARKPRLSSAPAGRLRRAWRAWVRMHTSKKCFAESDMTSEAAQSCRATRGHTSAYRVAERLGRPATESGKHGTTLPSKLTGPGWLWQGLLQVPLLGWSSRLRLSQEQVWTLSSGSTWPGRGLTLNCWRGNTGRLDGTGDSLTGASDVLSPWSGSGVRVSFGRSWAVSGGPDGRGGGRHVSSRPPSSAPAASSAWPTQ